LTRIATIVTGAAVLTALLAGGATAGAAPATTGVAPAKVTQLQKLHRLNGQYISLSRRARACPAGKAALRSSGRARTAALKNARKSSVRALRKRNTRMSRAVLALAKGAGRCRPAARTVTAVAPGGGSGGAGNSTSLTVVPSPGAPPGTLSLGLRLPNIGDAPLIDLSSALEGGVLPNAVEVVSVDGLLSGLCTSPGAACVGIDPAALAGVLTGAVADAPLLGPIARPLLGQVLAALAGGDVGSLLEVRRIGDRVIRLVPAGPLATLLALVGDVVDDLLDPFIGRIQLV
jgi:hypothetical protein